MNKNTKPVCGIVMPISEISDCDEAHWQDVNVILNESITNAGFSGDLVSNADDVGVIHKRIIQNLYENDIIVCDVSCKNPNVMFELGLRLAFDKPTIIVKDDLTAYSFDTSAIEHLEYPRDLRFNRIIEFKARLTEKIAATYKKSKEDSNYTTFLKHFGEFKVAKLDEKEVSGQEYIIEELKNLRESILHINRNIKYNESRSYWAQDGSFQARSKKIKLRFDDFGKLSNKKVADLSSKMIDKYPNVEMTAYESDAGTTVEAHIPPELAHRAREIEKMIKDAKDSE